MEAFIKELQTVVNDLRGQADGLAADSRQDDADLVKIRANIYEVCMTIAQVVCRTQPADMQERAYLEKLDGLPRSWKVARRAALDHGNALRAAVEEIKLEALEDALARFHARKES